jgi:CDP-4-dehydro-6-deoxyglucose reductase, E1
MTNQALKAKILELTREYSKRVHAANRPGSDPEKTIRKDGDVIPYAGRVFDEDEVEAAVSATLDFWLTLGPEGEELQKELAALIGVKRTLLVNSGSSANLIAVASITTHKLPAHRRLMQGDEIITCAAGFPTTVAPIIQNGAVPVFIDNHPFTGNACMDQLEAAYNPEKTKAVMFAHTLGNPMDLASVVGFCHKHDLWLIEDNCDALGSLYTLPLELAKSIGLDHLINLAELGSCELITIDREKNTLTAPTGSFGDFSTQSFYPPHHLTMGEGGAVNIVRKAQYAKYTESFRDWGRDCWCPSGKDNTCNNRFGWLLGELPQGYDHKYVYSHLGYNVKPLDTQAAIGRQQLKKLSAFTKARKDNWEFLRRGLAGLDAFFEFSLPTHATGWSAETGFSWDESGCSSECSWFGFMLLVKSDAPFTKSNFATHLDENGIGNRMLFGGNLLRQPAFVHLRRDRPDALRSLGEASGADRIMNEAIFIGTYPGLSKEQLNHMVHVIKSFAENH